MIKKVLKYSLLLFSIVIICYIIIVQVLANFYKVDENVYRSGVLNKYNLPHYIEKYKIKTILNLNGSSSKSWYKNEILISKKLNVKHIDYKISNSKIYEYNKTSELLEVIKNAKKPLLIHCIGGADRTSLAAAIYLYGIKNKNKVQSEDQFSWIYGHLPIIRPHVKAMDISFDIFVEGFDNSNYKSMGHL